MTDTIHAYEQQAELYRERTVSVVPAALREWMNDALSGFNTSAKIFEIGSGTGRDAAYIQEHGYQIQVSDVATSFVTMLKDKGWEPVCFDVVQDELPGKWDLVLADAVLLHLTRTEFVLALKKVHASLEDDGCFAFTLKVGEGETISDEKLGMPRFFCYWQAATVADRLQTAGYSRWEITEHPGWLHVIAYK